MRPEDICHHNAYWQKWLQYSTTKDHFWGRTTLLTKFYAINPSQCLVQCKALNFLFCLSVEFISSYCGLGKPWPIVQLRYCLQGESSISSQGTSSICGCRLRTTKGPIRTEGIQKSERKAVGKQTTGGWSQGAGRSGYGCDSMCQSTRRRQSVPCHKLHFSRQPTASLKREADTLSAWRCSSNQTITQDSNSVVCDLLTGEPSQRPTWPS